MFILYWIHCALSRGYQVILSVLFVQFYNKYMLLTVVLQIVLKGYLRSDLCV